MRLNKVNRVRVCLCVDFVRTKCPHKCSDFVNRRGELGDHQLVLMRLKAF